MFADVCTINGMFTLDVQVIIYQRMYRGIEPIIMVVYRADIMKIIWINWLCLETKDGIHGGMMGDIGEMLEI